MTYLPEGVIAEHRVGMVPDDPIKVNCYPDCPACAQRRLIEWMEANIVIYLPGGQILACGPTATAKWEEIRQKLGIAERSGAER